MNKDEFLNKLKEALTDSVPPTVVRENIQYYNDYIDEEEQKGRSEEEVLEELGNPRLIAHTIIDTTPGAGSYPNGGGSSSRNSSYEEDRGRTPSYHSINIDMSKWYWKVIAFIVLFVIILAVFSLVSGILSLFLPVFPIVFILCIMMWMFGGR